MEKRKKKHKEDFFELINLWFTRTIENDNKRLVEVIREGELIF